MVMARAWYLHSNGLLDIEGIFTRVTVSGPPFQIPMIVLAKVKFDPLRAEDSTTVLVRLKNIEGSGSSQVELPYQYPTFEEWLKGASAYIQLRLSEVVFSTAGEWALELVHEGNLVARETFRIVAKESGCC